MKLHSIQITNLRTHAHSVIDFPAAGLIGICGENGAGKSSVLEALTFALFGTKAIRGPKSGLRWKRAPATRKASVRLELDVACTRYLIERDEGNATVRVAGALELLASGTSAVDAYVPELVGMSLEEFSATFLCEQKSIDRIASMKPTERRTFVREVMQIGRIDGALKACRQRKNELTAEAAALQEGLGERAPLVAERDAAIAAIEEAHAHAEIAAAAAKQARQAAADASETLSALAGAKDRHDRAQAALEAAEEALSTAEHTRDRADAEREKAEAAIDVVAAADERLAVLPGLRAHKEELVTARAREGERASLQQLIGVAEHDVEKYSADLARCDAAIVAYDAAAHRAAKDAHSTALARLNELQQRRRGDRARAEADGTAAKRDLDLTTRRMTEIERQGPTGACPTCQRALGEQLASVLQTLRDLGTEQAVRLRRLEERAAQLAEPDDDELAADAAVGPAFQELQTHEQRAQAAARATRDRDAVQRQLDEARHALNDRRRRLAALPTVAFSAEALRSVTDAIAEIEALEREIAPRRGDVARMPQLVQQYQAAADAVSKAAERVRLARAAVVSIAYDPIAYASAADEAERLRNVREQAVTAQARAEGAATAAGERLARAEAAILDYDGRAGRLIEIRSNARTHEITARRLDEFRNDQVQLLRPELEALVSGFVSLLTDGRHESVTVTDDFDVVLQESGLDMEVISGGTQDIAAIALRLAISQMIAERAGHPLSLLILDEPFGSLSEVRRANVLNLIRQLGDLFTQVLLISHVDETKHAVDHVIEITFDEARGCSTVTQPAITAEAQDLAEVAA